MKRLLLVVAATAALGMAMAPAASAQQALSPGCQALNDSYYDGMYVQIFPAARPFASGEQLTMSAGQPSQNPPSVFLRVNGAVVDTATFPGTLEYTIPASATYTLNWGATGGGATWSVSCAAPDRDSDDDGFNDAVDNCPAVSNPGQENNDSDSEGDACDADDDNDNVTDTADNCQFTSNPDQLDEDDDGKGAACDTQELPASKDDCKDGGWERFDGTAAFKNQGDCVSYVATSETNPPAG